MQRRVPSPSPGTQLRFLTTPDSIMEEWIHSEGQLFHLPSQPLSWLSAHSLTGPPGRKPNVLSSCLSTASVYDILQCPTLHASWGGTTLPNPPRRPHLKIERLYWYLSAQVQCVPTSTQAAGKASWARRQAQSLHFLAHTHTHTKK